MDTPMVSRPLPFWTTLTALTCAGAAISLRLARPCALDDPLAAFVLLGLAPAAVLLLLGLLRRPLGVLAALLLPVLWTYVATNIEDSIALWLAPLACGLLIILIARRAQVRALPRPLPLAAAALALVALLWPAPGPASAGSRQVLIGADGLSAADLERGVAAGRMPALARLQASGRGGLLGSPPAGESAFWTVMATSVPADLTGLVESAVLQDDLGLRGRAFVVPVPEITALECLRLGARFSTLRSAALGRIAPSRGRELQTEAALQGDLFAELLRTRRPSSAAVLFPQAAQLGGAVPLDLLAALDRNLRKIEQTAGRDVTLLILAARSGAAPGDPAGRWLLREPRHRD